MRFYYRKELDRNPADEAAVRRDGDPLPPPENPQQMLFHLGAVFGDTVFQGVSKA